MGDGRIPGYWALSSVGTGMALTTAAKKRKEKNISNKKNNTTYPSSPHQRKWINFQNFKSSSNVFSPWLH